MKLWIRLAVAVLATVPAQAELFWHQSYDAAMEEAKRTGKPIFLEFRCAP